MNRRVKSLLFKKSELYVKPASDIILSTKYLQRSHGLNASSSLVSLTCPASKKLLPFHLQKGYFKTSVLSTPKLAVYAKLSVDSELSKSSSPSKLFFITVLL